MLPLKALEVEVQVAHRSLRGDTLPYGRDASLANATTSSATTVPVSMQDAFFVPSCPANVPNVSRGRRLPCLMSTSPAIGRMTHRVRFAPAARRSSGVAYPCPRGCIPHPRPVRCDAGGVSVPTRVHRPPQLRHTRVSRNCASVPGRRHPRAMAAAPAPDFHRLSGLPVRRDGSRPRRHRAAPAWPRH